jgi:hypothetical protein
MSMTNVKVINPETLYFYIFLQVTIILYFDYVLF